MADVLGIVNLIEKSLGWIEFGGEGSGHKGHKGVKGQKGGSAPGSMRYLGFKNEDEAIAYAATYLSAAERALDQEIASAYEKRGLGEGWGDAPRLYIPQEREVSALWEWSGDGHESINRYVRHCGELGVSPGPGLDRNVDALDAFFSRREAVIPEGIEVMRAFGGDFFEDKPVGTVFIDYGFVATSILPNPKGPIFAHGGGAVKVRVPKGTRAAYLSTNHNRPYEHEVLLNRGQTFKVIQNDNGGGCSRCYIVSFYGRKEMWLLYEWRKWRKMVCKRLGVPTWTLKK